MKEQIDPKDPKPYKCPECGEGFGAPTARGMHRRMRHGVKGSSPAAVNYRAAQAAKEKAAKMMAALPEPVPLAPKKQAPLPPVKKGRPLGSKTSTKRSNALANTTQTNGHQAHLVATNGHHPQGWTGASLPQIAVAVAYGRFTALCDEVAREFNVAPVSFTRELASFISRSHT